MQVDSFFGEEIIGAEPVEIPGLGQYPWAELAQGGNDASRRAPPTEISQVTVDKQIITGGYIWDFTAMFRMLMNIADGNDAHDSTARRKRARLDSMR